MKGFIGRAAAAGLLLALPACQPLDQGGAPKGPLKFETPQFADAIPASFGRAFAVSFERPDGAQIWFEKDDHSIVAVYLAISPGHAVVFSTITIPRR